MFLSVAVFISLVISLVSGTSVSPIIVVYEKVSGTDLCADIQNIKSGGGTIVVLGWYNANPTEGDRRPTSGSALEEWWTYDDAAITACAPGISLSMGIKIVPWNGGDDMMLANIIGQQVPGHGFSSVYWDVEELPYCHHTEIALIANNMNGACASFEPSDFKVYLSLPAEYLSTNPNSFCMKDNEGDTLKNTLEYQLTHVWNSQFAGIVVQYYNSSADFSTFDSIFVTAPSEASGSAIAELNSDVVVIKNKFIVGKYMKSSDNKNANPLPTDFVKLDTLGTFMCQAMNYDNYQNGLSLYAYANGDATSMAPLSQDCTGVTTPAPIATSASGTLTTTKASGSGTTLIISIVALIAGLAVITN